jgi:DnaJ-class molecular chaperone
MATRTCPDCDSPGDGNCPVCHGKGDIAGDDISGMLHASGNSHCSACHGSGACQTCGGMGEVEVGGES